MVFVYNWSMTCRTSSRLCRAVSEPASAARRKASSALSYSPASAYATPSVVSNPADFAVTSDFSSSSTALAYSSREMAFTAFSLSAAGDVGK